MRTSSKAILLSALVYPGAGQFYLKRYVVGAVLASVATVALVAALIPALKATRGLLERIERGELLAGPALFAEVQEAAAQAAGASSHTGLALLGAWLIGIGHAWHVARSLPEKERG